MNLGSAINFCKEAGWDSDRYCVEFVDQFGKNCREHGMFLTFI